MKSQIGTSNNNFYGGIRKLPYVFTEQGVAMLSSVLRTKNAAKVSVNIMNAFVYMRRFINENKDIFKRVIEIENKTDYIESTLKEYDKNFEVIFGLKQICLLFCLFQILSYLSLLMRLLSDIALCYQWL